MKFIDEYRDKHKVQLLIRKIEEYKGREITFMEVCGGHTMSIHRFGIPSLLPKNIKLVSGPGCPVCVTDRKFIDKAVAYSRLDNVIITTFGDLIRVPGSSSNLDNEKAAGADIRIVYSINEAIEISQNNPDKIVIFLGIGFETTAPGTAVGIIKAEELNLENFFVLSAHKIMPPAMSALIDEGVKIDGYIAPGHVSVITGSSIYQDIPLKYSLSVVISGFEPVDILQSIMMLINQIENQSPKVEIQYSRVVKPEGNIIAQKMLDEVFELQDDWWRGLGILPKSGLKLKPKFARFDIEKTMPIEVEKTIEPKGCICGDVLKGLNSPKDCKLFEIVCTPQNPIGACMVSNEGACAAFYKYSR